MKFRTEIRFNKAPLLIGYERPILMLGSCFTDNIGSIFRKYLFNIEVNPFGVTYNPLSINQGILNLLKKDSYHAEDLSSNNDLYFSFDHYTKYSGSDKTRVLSAINESFLAAKKQVLEAGTLVLTFGSAYVYELKENGRVVNNCHKLPSSSFNRRLLSVEEIVNTYSNLLKLILSKNPDQKILFTVSPVRHIKDGLVENQHSKSTLILAVHELEHLYPDTCFYFPSYEIMMDDLRDYRFYNADMLHPNDQAIKYIWELFSEHMINESARKIIKEIEPLLSALNHRPIHPETAANLQFKEEIEHKRKILHDKFPHLNWSLLE